MKTLVLGLGNILLSDEGVGVHVIHLLRERYDFPQEVEVMDGGTLALDLLPYVEDAERLLIVDAVQMNAPSGTVVRLVGEEIPGVLTLKYSPHQMGLSDLLAAAVCGAIPRPRLFCGASSRLLWMLGWSYPLSWRLR